MKNNDEVKPGQRLFDIDPVQYRIAVQRSRSDYDSMRQSVNASTTAVAAARASLQAAVAHNVYAQQDATRMEQIYKEDSGAVSLRRVQNAQANRLTARSNVAKAEADLRRAQDTAGLAGDKNAQLLSARAAIEKLSSICGRSGGSRRRLGDRPAHRCRLYAQVGASMTLIAIHDLWIRPT
jgi:multidrug resistance efflux pump